MFVDIIDETGCLIYFKNDENLQTLVEEKTRLRCMPYYELDSEIDGDRTIIKLRNNTYETKLFGKHNMQKINAARLVCNEIGINNEQFFVALSNFKGAAKRLQLVAENKSTAFYIDFAHAPSKLKATTEAVKQRYPNRKLVACIELHTFSSLNKAFLPQYFNSMDMADTAIVYFNPHVLEHKNLESIDPETVAQAFGEKVIVFTNSLMLQEFLLKTDWNNTNLLMMSSGNFDGINFDTFSKNIVHE